MIDKERTWLIWSTEHQGFWRHGGSGYTPDANKAAHYSWEEAKKICDNANRYSDRIEERMIKASEFLR
jgi:hypothetical protein